MKRIMIIAGESSGDLHAAELIKATIKATNALRTRDNNNHNEITFFGIGGEKMRQCGAEILIDNAEMAVVGIVEVLTHFKIIRHAFNTLKAILKKNPPDLLILVDYPGFNLRLAKVAHRYGVKTLYFISPQLWAWKKGRIKIIKKCIDKMAVILPFEVDFYKKHNVDAVYVGNPLTHTVKTTMTKTEAYRTFNLDPKNKIIALLPGSRRSEVKYNFQTLLDSARLLQKKYPHAQFVMPVANTLSQEKLHSLINESNQPPLPIKLIPNALYNLLQICDAAICVSGTVTLEIALLGIPFAIIYKLSPISFAIGRLLVNIDMFGLCNIVAEEKIAQEFIQHQATPEAITKEIIKIIEDKNYHHKISHKFLNLKNKFEGNHSHAGVCDVDSVHDVHDVNKINIFDIGKLIAEMLDPKSS